MKRFLHLVLFLLLTAEAPYAYGAHWHLPFGLTYGLLFDWKPLAAPFIDIFTLIIIFSCAPLIVRPDPMRSALLLSLLSLGLWSAYGIATGGSAYQVQFQIHTLVISLVFVIACRRALRTPQDFLALGKTVLYAALYRASMCVLFYLLVLRQNVLDPPPQFCTSHDDTVLFVATLVGLWVHLMHFPAPGRRRRVLWASALILAGIYLNNRRLAYVSLLSAVAMVYAAVPADGLRQLLKRYAMRTLPWLALYVAVGWGRPEAVFAPLRSLSSVAPGQEDASTRSRDAENAGLIFTLRGNPALGTGWGHEYTEVDSSLSAHDFAQYRYVPHNSLLGLLAFCGFLGFAGVWMIWPVCAYLGSRACQHARDPAVRCLGLLVLVTLVVVINQMWGDMGLFSYTTTFLMAAACGCASQFALWEPNLIMLGSQPLAAASSERRAQDALFG